METKWIRALFSFSRKERNGIVVLLTVIFCLIVFGKLIPLFSQSEKTDFSKWEVEVDNYFSKANEKEEIPAELPVTLSAFDPNVVDSIGLAKMGIPAKVSANWLKYLQKGGRFRNKDGVKRIFGMTPTLFGQLDSFMVIQSITIPASKANEHVLVDQPHVAFKRDTFAQEKFEKPFKEPAIVLELNSVDSVQLLEIKGIGPVFASRIVRFRNLLGGYCTVSQLKEVYGIKPENFEIFSSCFTVDPSTIKTFNINFSTVQELGRHPYIGFKTARKILKLRDQKGKFSSLDDLSILVSADTLQKLSPYLRFSQ